MSFVKRPHFVFTRDLPFLIALTSVAVAFLLYIQSPPQIPLWYSLVIAQQQLVVKELIFVFPVLMLLLSIIHTALFAQKKFFEPELVILLSRFILIPMFLLWIALLKTALVIL